MTSIEGAIESSVERVLEKMEAAYNDLIGLIWGSRGKLLFGWLVRAHLVKYREHESVAKQLNSSDSRVVVYCN